MKKENNEHSGIKSLTMEVFEKKSYDISGHIDLYNFHTNEIKTIFRDSFRIKKGDYFLMEGDNFNKEYIVIDIIKSCDRNTQIVYGELELLRE